MRDKFAVGRPFLVSFCRFSTPFVSHVLQVHSYPSRICRRKYVDDEITQLHFMKRIIGLEEIHRQRKKETCVTEKESSLKEEGEEKGETLREKCRHSKKEIELHVPVVVLNSVEGPERVMLELHRYWVSQIICHRWRVRTRKSLTCFSCVWKIHGIRRTWRRRKRQFPFVSKKVFQEKKRHRTLDHTSWDTQYPLNSSIYVFKR